MDLLHKARIGHYHPLFVFITDKVGDISIDSHDNLEQAVNILKSHKTKCGNQIFSLIVKVGENSDNEKTDILADLFCCKFDVGCKPVEEEYIDIFNKLLDSYFNVMFSSLRITCKRNCVKEGICSYLKPFTTRLSPTDITMSEKFTAMREKFELL